MVESQSVVARTPQVSVIIPARNEEANLGTCLESLIAQTDLAFEIIVIDDRSTDHTKQIAQSFPGVRVLDAGPLPAGWTGKNNAVCSGARQARCEWLLFTDADTVHLPGSLARALAEAKENGAALLSYSPEQIAVTFWEMGVLPVVFAELVRQYPPSKVSDPASPEAAANGQYILVSHEAYDAIGGHAAVAFDILEDVALARAVKASGCKIRFRYAADAVRTRMYRNFQQLREGWTKNLALLFPNPAGLAVRTIFLWILPWMFVGLFARGVLRPVTWLALAAMTICYQILRIARAKFKIRMTFLGALVGMPMFTYLLLRSQRAHATGKVSWKGRTYAGNDQPASKAKKQTSFPAKKLA